MVGSVAQVLDHVIPSSGYRAQLVAAGLLPAQGFLPGVLVDSRLDCITNQVRQKSRFECVQLPTVVTILLLVLRIAGVGRLAGLGGGPCSSICSQVSAMRSMMADEPNNFSRS